MNIDKKLENILQKVYYWGVVACRNNSEYKDEPNEFVSQIKQSILKAIMEKEFVNKEWVSTRLTYIDKNFVYSKDIKKILGDTKPII